jgi:hypothetical protein
LVGGGPATCEDALVGNVQFANGSLVPPVPPDPGPALPDVPPAATLAAPMQDATPFEMTMVAASPPQCALTVPLWTVHSWTPFG